MTTAKVLSLFWISQVTPFSVIVAISLIRCLRMIVGLVSISDWISTSAAISCPFNIILNEIIVRALPGSLLKFEISYFFELFLVYLHL